MNNFKQLALSAMLGAAFALVGCVKQILKIHKETYMKKLILLLSMSVIAFSCAKKDDNNNRAPIVGSQQYVFQANNQCYDQINNIPVNPTLCQNAASSIYSCIVTATGQPAPLSSCQNQAGGFGGGVAQQCYGAYTYNQGGTLTTVQCGIQVNCSGQVLISQQTNQQVRCL